MLDIKIPDLKILEDNAIAAVKQIVTDAMDRLENGDVKFVGDRGAHEESDCIGS